MRVAAIIETSYQEPRRMLVEATSEEISMLTNRTLKMPLAVGVTFNIDVAYQYIQWIYHHRERFERLAKELRESADLVSSFPDIMDSLSIPPMQKPKRR